MICPDYRGRGRSDYDPDWRHYEARTLLDDLANLLAALGVERVLMLGTSLGGILAMGLAVLKPMALVGAILNDVGPALEGGGLAQILAYIAADRPQPDWATAILGSAPNLTAPLAVERRGMARIRARHLSRRRGRGFAFRL